MDPIIRVFPRRTSFTPTDDYCFIGDPPLFLPQGEEVHISVTFSWDMEEGKRLRNAWENYYPIVKLGGPAFGSNGNFIPGRYVKEGVIFTSRGCNNNCSYCLVPAREGKLRELDNYGMGNIVQDNNFLQTSKKHIDGVCKMLKYQGKPVKFSGGLQASLVSDWFVERIRDLKIDCLFLAADNLNAIKPLGKALKKLNMFGRRKLRIYCMIGLDETIEEALDRLKEIWNQGGLPFAQLYQPPEKYINYSKEWKDLARTWSRPAAMFALNKSGIADDL